MTDEQFIEKYEELLNKGCCDCNEMNCLDNDVPTKILNIVKGTKLEAKQLLEENQELKKKLEQCSAVADTNSELADSIDEHYKKQQKEFIEWLEQNIENEEYCYLAQNPSERCRKDVFEEVLSKYKEIVGGENE